MTIQELVRELSGNNNYNDNAIYEAEVLEHKIETREVIVRTISGPDCVTNVRLMTTIGDGFLIIPKIGSTVFIMVNPLINPFIILYGEVSSNIISASESIKLNGDDYGGLVKIQELTDKINVLENALNNLINLYNTHGHGGNGLSPVIVPFIDTDVIQVTNKTDIENPDVTHGTKPTE